MSATSSAANGPAEPTPSRTLTGADVGRMSRAFVQTAVLRSALELGVFDAVAAGDRDAAAVAARTGTAERGARILLNSCAALGLLETGPEGYRLPPGGEDLLVSGAPNYCGGHVRVATGDWEWQALQRLSESVRTGGTVLSAHGETPNFGFWEDFAAHTTPFTEATAQALAAELEPWLRGRGPVELLDVCCGHGVYGLSVLEHSPEDARLTLVDWPNVLDVTSHRVDERGHTDRVSYRPGDAFTTDFGGPYDMAVIANVLHHFAEDRATELLSRVGAAVGPDGRLVVIGFTVDEDAPPAADPRPHLFSLHMLTLTTEGETHSATTYRRMLKAAGFNSVELHELPGQPLRIFVASR